MLEGFSIIILNSILIGIYFYYILHSLITWSQYQDQKYQLPFTLICLCLVIVTITYLLQQNTITAKNYIIITKLHISATIIAFALFSWFVTIYNNNQSKSFITIYITITVAILIINLLIPFSLLFISITYDSINKKFIQQPNYWGTVVIWFYILIYLIYGFYNTLLTVKNKQKEKTTALFIVNLIMAFVLLIVILRDLKLIKNHNIENYAYLSFIIIMKGLILKKQKKQYISLLKSEEQYRTLYHNSNNAILILQPPDWKISNANYISTKIFKTDNVNIFSTASLWDFSPEIQPDGEPSNKKIITIITNTLNTGSYHFEWEFSRCNGERFPSNIFLSTLSISGKTFLQASIRDISEQKNYENSLIDTNNEWVKTFNAVPDCIAIIDNNYTIQKINKTFLSKLKKPIDSIIGKKCYHIIHDSSEPHQNCPFQKVIKTHKEESCEMTLNKLGEDVKISVSPLYNNRSQLSGSIHLIQNISDRKQTERLNNSIIKIYELANKKTVDDLMQIFLDEAEVLTNSTIGFFHFVGSDQNTIELRTWSTNTLKKMCSAKGKGDHYPIEKAGVWAECVNKKRPVIHNNYKNLPNKKGLPEGHAPIIRELVVPIFRNNKIMAILGVGNKEKNYTNKDVEIIQNLADFAWETIKRKKSEEELQFSLHEKTTLLQELYHRTKNNMQVISSIIGLEAQFVKNKNFIKILTTIDNKIKTMALVHQKLYQSKNLTKIDLNDYINELCILIKNSFETSKNIIFIFEISHISTVIDIAIPIGLIINELVTNSFNHAFMQKQDGTITIKLRRYKKELLNLIYSDNGCGLPIDFNISKTSTLGMQSIFGITTQQLSGTIQTENKNGFYCSITFPDNLYKERIKS